MNRDFVGNKFSPEYIQAIEEGKGIVYLIALARYYDKFGKIHHTWLNVSTQTGDVIQAEKYNDAD
jgi:hypothetical protein